ncbi:hypothetical protein HanRHA438_Chr09g0400541 [Helianthus annuus]|nr:hypothetical protein HanXRQr2_Chr09g0389021 [Helianthus annuus]KAF5790944.1 hypothetical protein HanXRQr2_Chr09g0389051 [Helianthus annuus]KAJ0534396.1 hypothetical protein HanIR_Chr09g0419331 [Helianthus annuus]KAJ0888302.1 hypothetical protein HanRHA438_Chr09g0400541 [Helianthus annuus]KAJ0893197.1 hypothetical protein HanPSC8_Chr09g0374901 [Helianthus annuus]
MGSVQGSVSGHGSRQLCFGFTSGPIRFEFRFNSQTGFGSRSIKLRSGSTRSATQSTPESTRSTASQPSQNGQTWSTVVSQDPECRNCTLASSCSWNDITQSY